MLGEHIAQTPSVYPVLYGNEEELSIRRPSGQELEEYELYSMNSRFMQLLQERGYTNLYKELLPNSGRLYVDVSHDELSTPECQTIQELATIIRSNEATAIELVQAYLNAETEPASLIIQRRVASSPYGWNPQADNIVRFPGMVGCHDNFGIRNITMNRADITPLIYTHIATRPFLAGAGLFTPSGPLFSQKQTALTASHCKTGSGIVRLKTDHAMTRTETLCNDVVLSDLQRSIRIGGTAITLAIAQTPLARRFDDFYNNYAGTNNIFAHFNTLPLDVHGTFGAPGQMATKRLRVSMGIQRALKETYLSDAMCRHAGEQPAELMALAEKEIACIDTIEKVLDGQLDFTALLKHFDWAVKSRYITKAMDRGDITDPQRTWEDVRVGKLDLKFDYLRVEGDGAGNTRVAAKGYGYSWRDRGRFKDTLDADTVERGRYIPPAGRATLRHRLMSEYEVNSFEWGTLKLVPASHAMYKRIPLYLPDGTSDQLLPDETSKLQYAKRRTG